SRGGGQQMGGMTDNSNTQFATLALWVARKHGLPVDAALGRVDARFRGSQNPDGGWGYVPTSTGRRHHEGSTATMTCAGLLALAVSHGVAAAKVLDRDPEARPVRTLANDQNLAGGLKALAGLVGNPLAPKEKGRRPMHGRVDGKSFYFLWSLER